MLRHATTTRTPRFDTQATSRAADAGDVCDGSSDVNVACIWRLQVMGVHLFGEMEVHDGASSKHQER